MHIVYFLLIGLLAGWLAGLLFRGSGFGVVTDLIIGCVGALIGGFVFGAIGVRTDGLIGALISATIGAVLLLAILKALRKNNR